MKNFLGKMGLNKLITPDIILSIFLLIVSIRFSGEVHTWFDIPESDDNIYINGGIHFSEMFNHAQSDLAPDWSPLYQFWYFLIYRAVPDSVKIFYISMRLTGILIPFFAYLLLRRIQVTYWLAAATSVFLLASYALWIVEPRVTIFTVMVLIFLWWATTFLKKRWQRFFGMAAGSLFLAYSRPEFFLLTMLLGLLAFGYLGLSLLKHKIQLDKGDFLFLFFSVCIPLLFLAWWGVPFSGSRTVYAFGQHYAKNVQSCFPEENANNMAWEEILARDFGNTQNMWQVIRANPLDFRKHLICNIQAFPGRFLKVTFTSAWGSSWLLIRLLIAFILFRITINRKEIIKRLIYLWKQDFLLLSLLSLGVLLLDIIFIYPREHYIAPFSIITLLLTIGLFGSFSTSEQKGWHQCLVIGLCLLLLMPSMGVLFDSKVPQKPVLKTVETLRALNFNKPMRLFATRPFRRSQSEIYFDENYYHIGYKPADIPFNEYIFSQQANVIVITQGGLDLKDDPTWIVFEENPQEFGFHQIPFDEGDQWGPWRIYIKD